MFALFEDAFPCFLLAVGSLTLFGHPRLGTFAAFGDGVLIALNSYYFCAKRSLC